MTQIDGSVTAPYGGAMSIARRNLFCSASDLDNEASVEQFFVNRLLTALGYQDSQIAPKTSLESLAISEGRRKVHYRPDYAMKYRSKVRWICDAKAIHESLDDWVGQGASYCFELNRRYDDDPVEYFMLTNGMTTSLYRWNNNSPVLTLDFDDFTAENSKYRELVLKLSPSTFGLPPVDVGGGATVTLRRRTPSELNLDFAWAHKQIFKREALSYGSAFMEFVKVIFLKLLSDREVRRSTEATSDEDGSITVPASEVRFSRAWIESLERDHPNPMDAVQFASLLRNLETQIQDGTKKRIFASDEHIRLSNETIKEITARFEHTDLYGMDADLNGRMFETFLNATLRGRDLGQYFTPRSVAKLVTKMAGLRAEPDHVDVVMDACCGTGGFLIEALTEMWHRIDDNGSLSPDERKDLKKRVAEESLYGVDVARDPALARIARINMYLHGDGGSRIYQLDALDKNTRDHDTDDAELRREKAEFRRMLAAHPGGFANVVLTNPPFAKEYSRSQAPEAELLDDYDLAFDAKGGARRALPSMRSSIMFLERYYDLLVPGGLMLSVVDDGILGSKSYESARAWLRERFLIRAVVSLPGDAFQRSQARVKTSLLVMEKRDPEKSQEQPPVFMYYCTAVGIDDSPRQRILPADAERRALANDEIDAVTSLYQDFRAGRPSASPWTVPGSAIVERMDVKAVLPNPGTRTQTWVDAGLDVVLLNDLLRPAAKDPDRAADMIDTSEVDGSQRYLRIRYDGFAEAGEPVPVSEGAPSRLFVVRAGDLVFSHINAIHGACAIVPAELDGCVITTEFTACRTAGEVAERVVWALVRSPVARADLLLLSTGIGRTRIDWRQAAALELPLPSLEEQHAIEQSVLDAEEAERVARQLRHTAQQRVLDTLSMDSAHAQTLLAAFKPPR